MNLLDQGDAIERTVLARSIGARAAGVLHPGATGRVLASFPRVCDLVTERGAVVALAWTGVEKGPLTVQLDDGPIHDPLVQLTPGTAFQVRDGALRLFRGESTLLRVDPSGAAWWNPRLSWEALRPKQELVRNSAGIVFRVVTGAQTEKAGVRWVSRLGQAAWRVQEAHRCRDRSALSTAIQGLCGLGVGLTPQGDDWLAGWLLGLRLAPGEDSTDWSPETPAAMVVEAASRRTTLLSRAFLACAAAGEASESWHVLLGHMTRDPSDEHAIKGATEAILSHGATSGAAMLEGFLAGLGLASAPRPPILGENAQRVGME